MIRVTKVQTEKTPMLQQPFREHALAHKWCQGEGIEVGASAHNAFNLPGARNLVWADEQDFEFYKQQQIEVLGAYAEPDIRAAAESTGLPDASQDYVISSHVVEHFPNPIQAFAEWSRIVKPGGIIFMIIPQRNALPSDMERPISSIGEIVAAYENGVTVDTIFSDVPRGGHYYVYDIETFLGLIAYMNEMLGFQWEVVDKELTDTKVGNGFTVVVRSNGPVTLHCGDTDPNPLQMAQYDTEAGEFVVAADPGTESLSVFYGRPESDDLLTLAEHIDLNPLADNKPAPAEEKPVKRSRKK